MQNVSYSQVVHEEYQPIYDSIDNAKQSVNQLKSKMTQCVDRAITTLEATPAEGAASKKNIDKEIKNLKTLKKEISKAKIENGDQAEKIVLKVKTQIYRSGAKCHVGKLNPELVKDLSVLAKGVDKQVKSTSDRLNTIIQKEIYSVPAKQLTLTKKLQNILEKISAFFSPRSSEAKLSDIEKAAHKLEALVPQKNALIQSEWKKGLPAEAAKRKPSSSVEKEIAVKRDIKTFQDNLRQNSIGLAKKYQGEIEVAEKQMGSKENISGTLEELSIQLNSTSALLNSAKGTPDDIKKLKKLVKSQSQYIDEVRSHQLPKEKARLEFALDEVNSSIKRLKQAKVDRGLDDTDDLKAKIDIAREEKQTIEFQLAEIDSSMNDGDKSLQAWQQSRDELQEMILENRNQVLSGEEGLSKQHLASLHKQLNDVDGRIAQIKGESEEFAAVMSELDVSAPIPEMIEEALSGLKQPITPEAFSKAMASTKQLIDDLQKQVEEAREKVVGSAHRAKQEAELKLKTLELCLNDEWPNLATPDFNGSKAQSAAYVADARRSLEKATAFFEKDLQSVRLPDRASPAPRSGGMEEYYDEAL
ncbi:MAG: hypothetical protein Q8K75_07150 [Chlamydiales bacterium]|nr:hypothetical protein [Chlamydiales bacterium]